MALVEEARLVATAAHAAVGQKRKFSGRPYIVHPERVVRQLIEWGVEDENILAAAWLHDVVEDTGITFEMLRNPEWGFSFPEEVLTIVDALTGTKTDEPKETFRAKKMEHMIGKLRAQPAAWPIKLADRLDNLGDLPLNQLRVAYLNESEAILRAIQDELLTTDHRWGTWWLYRPTVKGCDALLGRILELRKLQALGMVPKQ
jgi:(p)ppGpp synthase/HD superfamily hydrolase